MTLPLAKRGSQSGELWPSKETIFACFEVASTPEAADYMSQQFDKKLERLPRRSESESSFVAMSEKIKEYVRNVYLQRDARNNPWEGGADIKTDFQNLQKNLAESIAKEMPAPVKESVKMDFALSDKADLLRAFSVDGQEVDKDITDKMDTLLNACLANNNLVSKNGAVYEADEKGNLRQDAHGKEIRASAEQLLQIILKTLQQFLQDKGISITTVQHAWPGQQAPTAKQAETSKPAQVEANDPIDVATTPASDEVGIGATPSN